MTDDAKTLPTARYRKRPVVIDAYQTTVPLDIETLEGTMHANPGDWIITGLRGEKYPCKPDIFAASYEPEAAVEASSEAWNLLVEAAARDEQLTQARTQVAALQEQHRAIGQHLLDTHKPGEVDPEAVAILDGYHVGAREVAGGGQGEPGETTLQAALRLLKLAHARGAFASANPPAEPGWTGGEVIDASPAIRCWPAAGVVFMGPDGPTLSIDPMDGGNVALVHLGDVVEYKRSSDFDLLMLKHKVVMRKVAESLAPAKETP